MTGATDPAIAILPYGLTLGAANAQRPLSELNWPLGCPDRLTGKRVADMAPDDHLIVYPKTALHVRPRWHCPARVSMMVVEPNIMHGHHLRLLRATHRRFFRVFSYDRDFLARIPNGIFLPYGTTWVPDWRDLSIEKTAHMSLIASAKRDHPGHKLRHAMVEFVQQQRLDVQVMGRGYTPFDRKSDGLAPFRYSIVIENVQQPNYFSEKLIDAILCETVPIYWGCPNIGEFIDTSAMILCDSEARMQDAIRAASVEDYQRRLPALRAIKPVAATFDHLETRAATALRDSL
ncbi:glycosyltransferase family 10 domain-containing protein [Sedimentitalea sp. HM32M-2]|uniref:glycosyltransferase family 10 domain-containing protein n=1 Tax=Sedimentitalea sp. HM32M-2 TaxID=3351566 RepID=UPI00363399C3